MGDVHLGQGAPQQGPGVAKVNMMAKVTLGNDPNEVGDTHHPCAEPVWHLSGARRTLQDTVAASMPAP
jgi:hypothetical protein